MPTCRPQARQQPSLNLINTGSSLLLRLATNVWLPALCMAEDESDGVEWVRVLWKRQPFPDNYVPKTFLSSLSTNGMHWHRLLRHATGWA